MATAISTGGHVVDRPKQSWVVGPVVDMLFIVAAPIIALAVFAPMFLRYGPEAVFAVFAGFNLGHHVPTFIRIYGDKNLLNRFRWNLLLGPVIPFTLAMLVVTYLILNGHDIRTVLILAIVLVVWDPWHFLMQNHGFMRIYDRHNQAPRKLAGRMDLALMATWFVFIMLSAVNWLPVILYGIHRGMGIPLLYLLQTGVFQFLHTAAMMAAAGMSVAYGYYLWWCYRKGYHVSYIKLLYFLILNAVMYLTYVPNAVMSGLLPGWTFLMGFATLGMVHVSQYLAIVWKYNRVLASRQKDVRSGVFQKSFGRGGLLISIAYVGICLSYGYGLLELWNADNRTMWVQDGAHDNALAGQTTAATGLAWLMGLTYAVIFTSTLTHYYYDGFIWKVRHKENRQNLEMPDDSGAVCSKSRQSLSWWDSHDAISPIPVFFRQCLYFGTPILLVIVSSWVIRRDPVKSPVAITQHVLEAQKLGKRGLVFQANKELKFAIQACERLLKIENMMISIRPTPTSFALISDLTYLKSRYYALFVGPHEEGNTRAELLKYYRDEVEKSITYLEKALAMPAELGELRHDLRPDMTREKARQAIVDMRNEISEINRTLSENADRDQPLKSAES